MRTRDLGNIIISLIVGSLLGVISILVPVTLVILVTLLAPLIP